MKKKKLLASSCLSVRPLGKLGFHWKDFHAILCLSIFRKSVQTIPVSLYSEDQYTCVIISLSILLRARNVAQKIPKENQNTHFMINISFFFLENRAVYEIML